MALSFSQETTRRVLLAAGLLGVLAWVFGPTLVALGERWGNDSRYTHGYLVPLFSLYLLWQQREALRSASLQGNWWGVLVLAAGLGISAAGTYVYLDWLNALALPVCLAGLAVLCYGWPVLRPAWPALAFLLFMVPLPFSLEVALAHPLQRIATRASTLSLQTLGFAAFSEGNTIRMGSVQLGVVEACSGLSMLMIFFALCTAVAILLRRPLWERLLVVATALPIALFANITRIVVTGVLHKVAGAKLADRVFHDLAGWLMMPLALGMLWVGYRLFSWAFPLRPPAEEESLALFTAPAGPPATPPAALSSSVS
jgi:exosortase